VWITLPINLDVPIARKYRTDATPFQKGEQRAVEKEPNLSAISSFQ
jgi:hypothetical protein